MLFNVPIIMCQYKRSLNSLWLYYPWTMTFLPHSPHPIHHQILTLETLLNSTAFSPHPPLPTPIQTTGLLPGQQPPELCGYISTWDRSSLSPGNNQAQAVTHSLPASNPQGSPSFPPPAGPEQSATAHLLTALSSPTPATVACLQFLQCTWFIQEQLTNLDLQITVQPLLLRHAAQVNVSEHVISLHLRFLRQHTCTTS